MREHSRSARSRIHGSPRCGALRGETSVHSESHAVSCSRGCGSSSSLFAILLSWFGFVGEKVAVETHNCPRLLCRLRLRDFSDVSRPRHQRRHTGNTKRWFRAHEVKLLKSCSRGLIISAPGQLPGLFKSHLQNEIRRWVCKCQCLAPLSIPPLIGSGSRYCLQKEQLARLVASTHLKDWVKYRGRSLTPGQRPAV